MQSHNYNAGPLAASMVNQQQEQQQQQYEAMTMAGDSLQHHQQQQQQAMMGSNTGMNGQQLYTMAGHGPEAGSSFHTAAATAAQAPPPAALSSSSNSNTMSSIVDSTNLPLHLQDSSTLQQSSGQQQQQLQFPYSGGGGAPDSNLTGQQQQQQQAQQQQHQHHNQQSAAAFSNMFDPNNAASNGYSNSAPSYQAMSQPQQQQQAIHQQLQNEANDDSLSRNSPMAAAQSVDTPLASAPPAGPFAFPSAVSSGITNSISAPPTVLAGPSYGHVSSASGGAEGVEQNNVQKSRLQSQTAPAHASPIDARPSSNGLTSGQMEPQFALEHAQSLMVNHQLSSSQGQELAIKACADLSNSYNKIADVLRQYAVIDMQTRMRLRQDFCASVSALDLSPAGPGYIGTNQEDVPGTRKRAFTLNSADGDDSNKHRRTISVTSDARSEMSALMRSPHAVPSNSSRPPLGQHTHSSPLLPAENHYRSTSSGMSDPVPAPKASDLATSGSHLVGRPTMPTPLYQSVLATDRMLNDGLAQITQDGVAPSQIQTLPNLSNGGILSPTPIPAPTAHLGLASMQGGGINSADAGQALYSQDMQHSFMGGAIDPSQMQVQPSTTPTPTQQQTYITPPMNGVARFAGQPGMNYLDTDMTGSDSLVLSHDGALSGPTATPTSSNLNLSNSGGARSKPLTGSLDFTTLRPTDDDLSATSPYASSHISMSSFPFSNSVTSQTSGSRSRATSVSRTTSASRSRAPSINSMQHNLALGPDAQELHNILGSLNAMPSPINEDDDDEDAYQGEGTSSAGRREILSPELTASYNRAFAQWLPRICSDIEATDRKGEKIHQPLMAKKMAKLDEEHAFRPFKFRIQPFTNSFQDACRELGLSEADTAPKLIKHFLWNQPLISRFNDEGKKTKSRGNHVWSIEARYLAPGRYEFRPPAPKIVPLPATAAPNVPWTWSPKVLDSSCQGPPMSAQFSCPNLPTWLDFTDNVLQGTPPADARSVMLDIVAEYQGHKLVQTFTIAVVAEDGVRPVAHNTPARDEHVHTMQPALYGQTPTTASQGHHGNYSGSSLSSDLTRSTNSLMTPPSAMNMQGSNALLPSPITSLVQDGSMSLHNGPGMGAKVGFTNSTGTMVSPNSPHQGPNYGAQMPQPVPFYLPTHPTDVTTLASAQHIKHKLVEATTIHHENMSALNPQHPPPDPAKVSVAVDAAINRQLAMSSHQPAMPTAAEVFNATLEVSTRSQQMQQEQLTHAVTAVTQSIQQQPQLSTQVTSQLANFSFTPSNTPGNGSPDTSFVGQQS